MVPPLLLPGRIQIYVRLQRRCSASFANSGKPRAGPVSPIVSAVERATIILSHQPILENFVHHNPFEELQRLEFRDAIQYTQTLEAYVSPGERAFHLTGIDPRKREKGALVDLSAVFLDRGATKWAPRFRDQGFLFFFASLEGLGFAPWRRHARKASRKILLSLQQENADAAELSEQIIRENLEYFGIPPEDWDSCVRSMLLKVRGWAGMFHRMETHPLEAPLNTRVSLIEFCAAQSIISRAAIETVATQSGWDDAKTPLSLWLRRAPTTRKYPIEYGSVRELSVIANDEQSWDRMEELEKNYEQKVIDAVSANVERASLEEEQTRSSLQMQFITCIDDREGSLRRHLEEADSAIPVETFGVAGFFGLPISYKSIDSHVGNDMTPDGKPIWHVADADHENLPGSVAKYRQRRRHFGQINKSLEALSFSPAGSLLLSTLAPLYFGQLVLMGYAPLWNAAIWESLFRPVKPVTRVAFKEPVSASAAASVLAGVFKSTGIYRHFSPFVVVLGHGASSYNNPFSAAYNCGACGGHSGGGNARVFVHLANDLEVRACLREEHNLSIPQHTVFIAGEHDTTADDVILSNENDIPPSHLQYLRDAKRLLSEALGKNALERCHRFLLSKAATPKDALRHVRQRSVDFAEVRPELNHAANAAVIVGRRSLTRGSFFDRRNFLPSYDPYLDDDEGTQLESVLAPALNVCSGINLEYLFSTIAIDRHGAGSKAPLNAVGNIGVQHGTYGDLRTGLPSQMVEMHIPIRAIYFVDSPVAKVESVFKRRPDLEVLVRNNWVRMVLREPNTGQIYHYIDGAFVACPMETTGKKREQLTVDSEWAAFKAQRDHGMSLKNREDIVYGISTMAMLASLFGPLLAIDGAAMMNPHGAITAACATGLALPVLAFSRRYLHGEYLFTRFSFLSSGLLLGFNLVATAPSLEQTVAGWGLFGFASTFLIGSYNDRPSVRNNALFAFAAYRVSDFALLTAMTFASPLAAEAGHSNPELVAGCLLLAAMFKSSQFPLTALFARSMEGPTPTSALGYAGLSAHVGVVLLASTADLWFPLDEARIGLATIGASTALYSGIVSQIHADRKGALAYATSSTLGAIYVIMAAGYINEALALAMGHASFRIVQVLRSPGSINDSQSLTSALDAPPWPTIVPDWLFRLCWSLHRLDTDAHAVNTLHQVSAMLGFKQPLEKLDLSQPQLWGITGAGLVVAGMPFTPASDSLHILLEDLLITDPALASCVVLSHFGVSILTMRFMLLNILSPRQKQSVNQISSLKSPHVPK
jgi:uncharacterized protein YbcC (UPF0753/DUF2309 family)